MDKFNNDICSLIMSYVPMDEWVKLSKIPTIDMMVMKASKRLINNTDMSPQLWASLALCAKKKADVCASSDYMKNILCCLCDNPICDNCAYRCKVCIVFDLYRLQGRKYYCGSCINLCRCEVKERGKYRGLCPDHVQIGPCWVKGDTQAMCCGCRRRCVDCNVLTACTSRCDGCDNHVCNLCYDNSNDTGVSCKQCCEGNHDEHICTDRCVRIGNRCISVCLKHKGEDSVQDW